MLIHALHTHNYTFLFAVKHQGLFVDTAFDLEIVITGSAFIIATRLVTAFASVYDVRSFPLAVKIRSTLSI